MIFFSSFARSKPTSLLAIAITVPCQPDPARAHTATGYSRLDVKWPGFFSFCVILSEVSITLVGFFSLGCWCRNTKPAICVLPIDLPSGKFLPAFNSRWIGLSGKENEPHKWR